MICFIRGYSVISLLLISMFGMNFSLFLEKLCIFLRVFADNMRHVLQVIQRVKYIEQNKLYKRYKKKYET